jgi:hypothetical protein
MTSYTNQIEAKKQLHDAFSKLLLKRRDLLVWYAHKLDALREQMPDLHQATGATDTTLLIKAIERLDDEFAKKEESLYHEFADWVERSRVHLKTVEQKEEMEMAYARIKNKVNIAVAAVKWSAKEILPQARMLGVSGSPLVRLEYLSELTLKKQMAEFYDVLNRPEI